MKGWIRTVLVAAMVGLLALATAAIAQDSREEESEERKPPAAERLHRNGLRQRGHCRLRHRLVHSETKVQLEEGFGLRVLDVGEITGIDGNTITIERADGETVSATGDEDTRVCRNAERASLEDLQVGDRAALRQAGPEGELTLRAVMARSPDAEETQASPQGLLRPPFEELGPAA